MPLYEFHCEKCDKDTEIICSWSEIENSTCEQCGDKLKLLLPSRVGAVFKEPFDTSKWDSFSYRAGHNLEKAKAERRAAQRAAKDPNPYKHLPGD